MDGDWWWDEFVVIVVELFYVVLEVEVVGVGVSGMGLCIFFVDEED